MDQPKIERVLRLMNYMSGSFNYTIDELAEKLQMSPRTIYRYIDTFKNAGFAVVRLYGSVYKIESIPEEAPKLEGLLYFSDEEAYLVNSLIDRLSSSNSLKKGLKEKLAVIYDSTAIDTFVDERSNATHVERLSEAARKKKQVTLKDYESGNSHTIRDRWVEPFGFTTDYVDVWAYDIEDGKNKIFKVSRIGEVEIRDRDWIAESSHRKFGMDVFRMSSGKKPSKVVLKMTVLAKTLLVEEYPLAEKDITRSGDEWILDTMVHGYEGIGRFYLGLSSDIKIVDSPEFVEYVKDFIRKNLSEYV